MKARDLYGILATDFLKPSIYEEDWLHKMPGLRPYLFPEFIQNGGMGLMCDFATDIQKVYTTVFLSDKVLSRVLSDDISNAMIFSHHPTNWDLRSHNGNYAATEEYIAQLQQKNIAIYTLHHPLDNFGPHSTCGTLARELGIAVERSAFVYCGAHCGIIGTTDCKTIGELRDRYAQVVGHATSLYPYGDQNIQGQEIALCPGGGSAMFVVSEMLEHNIKTLITGISLVNDYSRETHATEKANYINLLGGTHYSSEKFAPMAMCGYFANLGLPTEFIQDTPDLFDL